MRRRFFLVEMCNITDARDDEVWKVRASTKATAKVIANSSSAGSPWLVRRLRVGRVVLARGGSRTDRTLARDFRTYCTKTFD